MAISGLVLTTRLDHLDFGIPAKLADQLTKQFGVSVRSWGTWTPQEILRQFHGSDLREAFLSLLSEIADRQVTHRRNPLSVVAVDAQAARRHNPKRR